MKSLWQGGKTRAFTLVELLVVIAIIAILAAMLLPTLTRGKQRAQRIQCIGDLNELGTAFQIFAHDHQGKFPMQTPAAEGGSMELVEAGLSINGVFYFSYRHLQTLENELVTPRILLCPSDLGRDPAFTFPALQNSNVSYFVGVKADYNQPSTILAGDRNITNDARATASLVSGTYGLRWTRELHRYKGNVLFSDSHVEQMNSVQMELPQVAALNAIFFLPAAQVPGSAGPSNPMPGGQSGPGVAQVEQPQAAAPAASPAEADSPAPKPASPPAMRKGMSGSQTVVRRDDLNPTIIETSARETNGIAANGVEGSPAPAATDDEPEPPLLWLQGAAKTAIARTSWWLLLLIMLLIVAAFYVYSRKKMRERRRRAER
jgi:prepilin-type N-terminal cleavage/methylation domain-containing protein